MENLLRSDSSDVSLPIIFQCVSALLNNLNNGPSLPTNISKLDSSADADADADGDADGDSGSYSLSTYPNSNSNSNSAVGRFRLLCLGLRMLRKSLTLPHGPSGPRRRVLRERIVSCCLVYFQAKPVWVGLQAPSSGLDLIIIAV